MEQKATKETKAPAPRCEVCGRRDRDCSFDGIGYSCQRCMRWARDMMLDDNEDEQRDDA